MTTRVRTMVCYRFLSPRTNRERERDRERKRDSEMAFHASFLVSSPLQLSTLSVALKARNIVTRTGFHCDIDAFRNREDGYVSGKWSHARHSRLIAAKLARSSTIRWNFRNFLLDHRSALVALRRNHGLECCWERGDAMEIGGMIFNNNWILSEWSDLFLSVKFFSFLQHFAKIG